VRDDDEVIASYERELGDERRPSNRGFWMIVGTIAIGSVILLVEIFAHRPIANDIARTQRDLRVALNRAESLLADAGSLSGADADGLARAGGDLTFLGPDEGSRGPGQVSVYASSDAWAASVRSRTGTCFYVKRTSEGVTTYLIADGACTGREGLAATDDRW
jgi:hypothetical protein